MTKEPVEIKRDYVRLSTGEECIEELFDIERTLSDHDIEKIKNLVESLYGNFSRDEKNEHHIQIYVPRRVYSSKILTQIMSELIGKDLIELFVIKAYDEEEGKYSRRQALIRTFSVKTNTYLERVHDFTIHSYTSTDEIKSI